MAIWKCPKMTGWDFGPLKCLWQQSIPLNTLRCNNVVIKSKRRNFDVITSKWRRFDVITTSLLRNVSAGILWGFNLTRNCSKLRKIHSGQGHTSLPNDFLSKFKYVKPFFFLPFLSKSTDRYKIFHMTHSWQLCCCSMRQICCGLMIRN